jgi:hypothetical protein
VNVPIVEENAQENHGIFDNLCENAVRFLAVETPPDHNY